MRNEDTRQSSAHVALRAIWKIAERWSLTDQELVRLLGQEDEAALVRLRTGQARDLPAETIIRLSLILGIFKAINTIMPSPKRADAWVRKANAAPLFEGKTALDRLLSGEIDDLDAVRRYLDAQIY